MPKRKRTKISHDELVRLLKYDPETGLFYRRISRNGNNAKAGQIAGCLNNKGYRQIRIGNERHWCSDLAWFYMTGKLPPKGMVVDHKDGNKSNDAWANLRLATQEENRWNAKRRRDNTTGFKGVHRHGDKFQAAIQVNGKKHHLGTFSNPEDAFRRYKWAARRLHGKFARTGA